MQESRKPIVRNNLGNGNGQTTLLIGRDANKQDLLDQKRSIQSNYKAQLEADIRAKKMHQVFTRLLHTAIHRHTLTLTIILGNAKSSRSTKSQS